MSSKSIKYTLCWKIDAIPVLRIDLGSCAGLFLSEKNKEFDSGNDGRATRVRRLGGSRVVVNIE